MRRKKIWIAATVLCVLLIAGIVASQFVSVGMANLSEAHCALSFAFDKKQMQSVDRMVITANGRTVQITERALLDAVVEETMVATHMDVHCTEDRQIDLYAGDALVRSMIWSTCCDTVLVYDTDESHWVVSIEGAEEGGCIYLSRDLADKLNSLLGETV